MSLSSLSPIPSLSTSFPSNLPSSSSSTSQQFPTQQQQSSTRLIRSFIELSQTSSDLGFHTFTYCTQFSFNVIKNCLLSSVELINQMNENNSLTTPRSNQISNVIRNVHTTIGAAEAIALTSILLIHSTTSISLRVADITLELNGVPRVENSLWEVIRTTMPLRYTEYTPFIQRIAEMIFIFISPFLVS